VPVPPVAALPPPAKPGQLMQFTVDQYHRMIQTAILTEDDAVELLEGWVVRKMARNPPHDATISKVDSLLRKLLPQGWFTRIQSAVTTADSEPEPDVVIASGTTDDYMARHPGPTDVALVIEVADSSLPRDREVKGAIYARANVSRYWIVNLSERQVEVYSEPSGPAAAHPSFHQRSDHPAGGIVALEIPGHPAMTIAVRDLLPPAP
jgi:hypothetical protein